MQGHSWDFEYVGAKIREFDILGPSMSTLTLFETGGGKFAPDATNLSAISLQNVLGSPKFMTLFHSMSDLS